MKKISSKYSSIFLSLVKIFIRHLMKYDQQDLVQYANKKEAASILPLSFKKKYLRN